MCLCILRIGNLDPSIKALQAARLAAGRFFQVKENKPAIQCRGADSRQERRISVES